MQFPNKQELAALREKYPAGIGTVQCVDDAGNIHVK